MFPWAPKKHRPGCQHQGPTSHSHPSWLRHHAPQPVQHAHATPPPPLQQLCPFPSPLHLTHPAVLSAPTMMGTSVMPSTLGPAAGHRQTRSAIIGEHASQPRRMLECRLPYGYCCSHVHCAGTNRAAGEHPQPHLHVCQDTCTPALPTRVEHSPCLAPLTPGCVQCRACAAPSCAPPAT